MVYDKHYGKPSKNLTGRAGSKKLHKANNQHMPKSPKITGNGKKRGKSK